MFFTKPTFANQMTNQITILSHELTATGLSIGYFSQASHEVHYLNTDPQGACFLLLRVDFIQKFRFKKDGPHVQIRITEDRVGANGNITTVHVGKSEMTWEYFARHYEVGEVWAKEIVKQHEDFRLMADISLC
jgi:hypothetical protein